MNPRAVRVYFGALIKTRGIAEPDKFGMAEDKGNGIYRSLNDVPWAVQVGIPLGTEDLPRRPMAWGDLFTAEEITPGTVRPVSIIGADMTPVPPLKIDSEVDRTPRYAPEYVAVLVRKGVIYRGLPVRQYIAHPPGRHPRGCPLIPFCVALELVTDHGSSWWGFEEAYIGPELKMVVSGFPARDELRASWRKVPGEMREK